VQSVSASQASLSLCKMLSEKGGRKMEKLNSIILKLSSSLAALALLVGVSSVTSACVFWFNQPKMPKAIEKFRKDI
jgi:cyclic lactone autoinducer peptide